MNIYYNELIQKIDQHVAYLTFELDNPLLLSESLIEFIVNEIAKLKLHVLKEGFASIEDEIDFFKKLKPNIIAKLIYYNAIYKIETKRPHGCDKLKKKYLNKELSKLKRFFESNLEFYKYYRTNSTYLDIKYFVRGKHDIKLCLDTYYFESDHSFSTSHDYKVAKIIANDLIQFYLEDQKKNLSSKRNNPKSASVINWTASKTALIELIYALHSKAVIDYGNSNIKVITKAFATLFDIDLGDFYHTYLELRNRKNNRTKFLDSLRDSLIKKMDDLDEQ
ncbi:RteC domain-containing protein [Pedobacter metabolipauper]|uniref:RteC protein n=1 Tax=Pedobacter metabolipauper TaxID=425513 RepID=A0A4R6SXK9_9SPHI|nr:RteC domain-containing protein [Pedobacter metabolipauper]TDQ10211.1 RteC protein [Pedobacter metabolipauper]